MKNAHWLLLTTAFVSTTLIGCSSQKTSHSGFLDDYSELEPSPKVKDAYVYRKPGLDLGAYDKFIIDPIGVHFAPEKQGKAINPDDLKKLTDYFRNALAKELSKHYRVVDEPGPGVMRLRIAVTDLKKTTAALNIHPATKLSGLGLGGASVEAEGIDTQTRERLFAFVHTRPGDRLAIVEGLEEWGHAHQAMDYWAKQLVARLDEAHGLTAAK